MGSGWGIRLLRRLPAILKENAGVLSLLGGSCVVISRVISRVTILITHIRDL